jgi:RimJ/RimL family protein N-acetyltransferase
MLVQADRLDIDIHRGEQVEQRRITRIFDGNPVAGTQPCAQYALNTVKRAADNCQVGGVNPVGLKASNGKLAKTRRNRRVAILPRRRWVRAVAPSRRPDRQQLRIRRPANEIANAGRDSEREPWRSWWRTSDPGASAAVPARDPLQPQLAVRGRDRRRTQAEFDGQRSHGRQRRAWLQAAIADCALYVGCNLGSAPADRQILCRHIDLMYCNIILGVGVVMLDPQLNGRFVRLESLGHQHLPGLVAASAGDPELYRMSKVPVGDAEVARYIEAALSARDAGKAAPFAVVRVADGAVIGSSRLFDLEWWPWQEGHARHAYDGPDTCEIGYTWLTGSAIRTGANTEMKSLMLTLAFETWQVQSVCFHTDARNDRSRRALSRIGARYEGILRSHRLAADDRPRDSARFAITAADWPTVRTHLGELSRQRLLAS